jgi:hypothetical protein
MIKKSIALLLLACLAFAAKAQKPKLYALHGNAALIQYNKGKKSGPINGRTPRPSNDTLLHGISLPFYDDFSYAGPYPNPSLWLDQYVFVNHTKAIGPPTLGVATFDGLNQFGYPYDSTVTSANLNPASPTSSDTLTSHPIRLDSIPHISGLSPADSVYLSFYYQGEGFWASPLSDYELDLDLYSPIDSAWYNVWSVVGNAMNYYPDSAWHIVMIPITDSSYFANGFQFRFRNLSCGCGDDDHWHIDVVELSNQRYLKDTIFQDVSFVYDLQSPLKNYTQMPYNQYTGASDMRDSIYAVLRSNEYDTLNPGDSTQIAVSTYYNIFNPSGTSLLPGDTGNLNASDNLSSYYNAGYCDDPALIHPSLNNFIYPTPIVFGDIFTTKFYVANPGGNHTIHLDAYPQNDTTVFHQIFSNYFAYDDGSAEAAYGIESTNGPGNYQIAAQYVLNKTDTLRSIDIFFDPIIDVGILATSPFNLMVWADNGGVPGVQIYNDTIYNDSLLRYPYFAPNYPTSGIPRENRFLRYGLLKPLIINAGQVFYIGINQVYNYPAIPIGFDMNTDYHDNMFYNANNPNYPGWYDLPGDEDPSYRGSLMMRPVFGDSLLALGIKKYNNTISANIMVYPNPAADEVFIQSDNTITKIVVTDLIGNLVIQQTENPVQRINTTSLQNGAYLIKAFTDKGLTDTKKLIISR